jgi:transposase-like protein
MSNSGITQLDRALAGVCELCPVCRHASRSQKGLAFTVVKNIETAVCPFCKAYERVHGKKAHEKRDR